MSTKSWFFGNWNITVKYSRGYWRYSVSKVSSPKEYTGKAKELEHALLDALDELSRLSVETRNGNDKVFQGCKMCGNDYKSLNSEGYCSSCWTVWNS